MTGDLKKQIAQRREYNRMKRNATGAEGTMWKSIEGYICNRKRKLEELYMKKRQNDKGNSPSKGLRKKNVKND